MGSLEEAFRAARIRFGMRIVHYSIQGNHLHLLVEVDDRKSLARGMQGDLGVESHPGAGARFVLTLPRGHLDPASPMALSDEWPAGSVPR